MKNNEIIDETDFNSLNLGFLVSVANNHYIRQSDEMFEELNLNLAQTKVLLALYHKDKVSVDYLSDVTYSSKSSITKSVKHLEEKGLVTRERNPKDNRKIIITVTKKGKTVQKEAINRSNQLEKKINEKITTEKVDSMKKDLYNLIIELRNL